MANILRSIIAGPRARHAESNLDLCYVTPFLIATSGPSGTYPQRAYRNPLDQLVKYLDKQHGQDWCIWEFRAEGTGYPDSEVYGRVRHYPWPDHHPPPFAVVPLVMGSMRQWLNEGSEPGQHDPGEELKNSNGRVVVVHCKAGKGRSGTMACSYLISECGWQADEALARFTERRMRPGFGQGVSISSQLRYVGYVDRWTKGGKIYVEHEIEILEVHVWGLRDGVKVAIEGYIEEGKVIKTFHVFNNKERLVVDGAAPGSSGFTDMVTDMAGYNGGNTPGTVSSTAAEGESSQDQIEKNKQKATSSDTNKAEAGGGAVMFKPTKPIILPTSDVNIDFERRNKAGYGMTMVTSVAHVWFNTFFEGRGPEHNGHADATGVFEIDWDKMDGIKGSLRKGTRALDRIAVIWRSRSPASGTQILEPDTSAPVEQLRPADWKGVAAPPTTGMAKDLGVRTESPASANVSKANSVNSLIDTAVSGEENTTTAPVDGDDESLDGLRISGPAGEETI